MGTVMKEKTIWQDEKYFIIRREPSLTNLLPTKLRRGGLHEKLRWMVQYIYGYHVYILAEKSPERKKPELRKSVTVLRETAQAFAILSQGVGMS